MLLLLPLLNHQASMKMDKEAAALKATQDREKEVFEKAVSAFSHLLSLSGAATCFSVRPRDPCSR
jgi:hypothetical protein